MTILNQKLQNKLDNLDLDFEVFDDVECVTYCGNHNGNKIQISVYEKGGSISHNINEPYGILGKEYKTDGGFLNGLKKLNTLLVG